MVAMGTCVKNVGRYSENILVVCGCNHNMEEARQSKPMENRREAATLANATTAATKTATTTKTTKADRQQWEHCRTLYKAQDQRDFTLNRALLSIMLPVANQTDCAGQSHGEG